MGKEGHGAPSSYLSAPFPARTAASPRTCLHGQARARGLSGLHRPARRVPAPGGRGLWGCDRVGLGESREAKWPVCADPMHHLRRCHWRPA